MCVCVCTHACMYSRASPQVRGFFWLFMGVCVCVYFSFIYILCRCRCLYTQSYSRAILQRHTDRQSMFNDNVNLLSASTTANIAFEQYVMLPHVKNREILTRRDVTSRSDSSATEAARRRSDRFDARPVAHARRCR